MPISKGWNEVPKKKEKKNSFYSFRSSDLQVMSLARWKGVRIFVLYISFFTHLPLRCWILVYDWTLERLLLNEPKKLEISRFRHCAMSVGKWVTIVSYVAAERLDIMWRNDGRNTFKRDFLEFFFVWKYSMEDWKAIDAVSWSGSRFEAGVVTYCQNSEIKFGKEIKKGRIHNCQIGELSF